MSSKENLFISSIKKDVGSPHPIEEMKNKLVNIMESFCFSYEEGPEIETEENNFDILNRFITLAITKDPKKFVEDVTGKNFANVASDTKDPLIELLKPNTAKTVLNFIREVIIHGSKEHQSMSNEENKNKINQIIKLTSCVHYDTTKKQFTRLD